MPLILDASFEPGPAELKLGELVSAFDALKLEARVRMARPNLNSIVDDWYLLPSEEGQTSTAIYARFHKFRWVLSAVSGRSDTAACTLNMVPFCAACQTEFPHRGWVGRRCPRCSCHFVSEVTIQYLDLRTRDSGLPTVFFELPPRALLPYDVLDFEEV